MPAAVPHRSGAGSPGHRPADARRPAANPWKVDLRELGFQVLDSHANFLWCRRSDRPVKPIYEELKRRRILVRYMNYDGYDGLRVSVGTDAEIDRLLTDLRAIL